MREITLISGKGGTGKTSLTAAFASLAFNHIICDLDVDAADLHLLLSPKVEISEDFVSGFEAIINNEKCSNCGTCNDICNFKAISFKNGLVKINPVKCEGCGLCVRLCPNKAIDFVKKHCGEWYQSKTRFAPLIHAKLFPGEENSGLLVSLLRKRARLLAAENKLDIILSDGSPGIGCPVIASLTGGDIAVIVTEPTPSGMHDMERILDLCKHFSIKAKVIINKYDLNTDYSQLIEEKLREINVEMIGKIPFDEVFLKAMIESKTVIEYDKESNLSNIIKQIWKKIGE